MLRLGGNDIFDALVVFSEESIEIYSLLANIWTQTTYSSKKIVEVLVKSRFVIYRIQFKNLVI